MKQRLNFIWWCILIFFSLALKCRGREIYWENFCPKNLKDPWGFEKPNSGRKLQKILKKKKPKEAVHTFMWLFSLILMESLIKAFRSCSSQQHFTLWLHLIPVISFQWHYGVFNMEPSALTCCSHERKRLCFYPFFTVFSRRIFM